MSYSPDLSASFKDTKLRSAKRAPSCLCSFCTAGCVGTCEIDLSAMRGEMVAYPTNTGNNQVAPGKDMSIG